MQVFLKSFILFFTEIKKTYITWFNVFGMHLDKSFVQFFINFLHFILTQSSRQEKRLDHWCSLPLCMAWEWFDRRRCAELRLCRNNTRAIQPDYCKHTTNLCLAYDFTLTQGTMSKFCVTNYS